MSAPTSQIAGGGPPWAPAWPRSRRLSEVMTVTEALSRRRRANAPGPAAGMWADRQARGRQVADATSVANILDVIPFPRTLDGAVFPGTALNDRLPCPGPGGYSAAGEPSHVAEPLTNSTRPMVTSSPSGVATPPSTV